MDGSSSEHAEAVKKLLLQIHHHYTKGREGTHRRGHYLVKIKLACIMTSPIRAQMQWHKAVICSRHRLCLHNSDFACSNDLDLQLINQLCLSSVLPNLAKSTKHKTLKTNSRLPQQWIFSIQCDWRAATKFDQVFIWSSVQEPLRYS
eukprot:5919167-Ditylum_brightwellii.AAC.1